jgi:hypothetical protein
MTICTTCQQPMLCETHGAADEYWSEYCLSPGCADPQCNHGGPDIDGLPEIRLEKCWVNPAYRDEVRWEVTFKITAGMTAHLYESSDRTLALKYARETAERTSLSVNIYDRTN